MKAFVVAVVASLVIAIVGGVALTYFQKDAEMAYHSSTGVRI